MKALVVGLWLWAQCTVLIAGTGHGGAHDHKEVEGGGVNHLEIIPPAAGVKHECPCRMWITGPGVDRSFEEDTLLGLRETGIAVMYDLNPGIYQYQLMAFPEAFLAELAAKVVVGDNEGIEKLRAELPQSATFSQGRIEVTEDKEVNLLP